MDDERRPVDQQLYDLLDEQLGVFTSGAAVVLGGQASCSVMLRLEGGVRRSASSDPLAAACDEVELAVDDGPCLDALETGLVMLVDDLDAEDRWPAWTRTARAAGFRSSGGFPVHLRSQAAVAVNVYRPGPGPWDRDSLVRADVYAQQLGRVVDLCLDLREANGRRHALEDALAAQASIDQAVGAIMATKHCDASAAFAMLIAAARDGRSDLSDVAVQILEELVERRPGGEL